MNLRAFIFAPTPLRSARRKAARPASLAGSPPGCEVRVPRGAFRPAFDRRARTGHHGWPPGAQAGDDAMGQVQSSGPPSRFNAFRLRFCKRAAANPPERRPSPRCPIRQDCASMPRREETQSMAIEGRSDAAKGDRIRLGMVGGGEGAFIGAVHRIASRIDNHYEVVAGALSSTPEKARRSGAALGLAADRIYDDYESMAKAEARRADGIEAVAIVTPNNVHAGPTYAFLKAGVHVICDKPLTVSLAEAKKMRAAVEKSGLVFALTHNYTGYPLVRRMREMVRAGELGKIRLVHAEYPQDWLAGAPENAGNKQAEWRVDPKRSGAGGSLGDIGTHAYNLADYVTGLELTELAADLT